VAVLCADWGGPDPELAFVLRRLAGALSRSAAVAVLAPGRPGAPRCDGLFDIHGVGVTPSGGWPEVSALRWPAMAVPDVVLFRASDDAARSTADRHAQGARRLVLADGGPCGPGEVALLVDDAGEAARLEGAEQVDVGLHVPINPLAAERRHNALGDIGYLLVLTDRPGTAVIPCPPDAVAWLSARFPKETVLLVEGGRAQVWRTRARRGEFGVDSRTDLWRLMAHAAATVDLAPGSLVGRECVESMRFGTPTVVPATAPRHATDSAALRCSTPADLLGAVARLLDPKERALHSAQGKEEADHRYGDAGRFVSRVATALGATGGADPPAGRVVGHRRA
jgi:hypothetical protein